MNDFLKKIRNQGIRIGLSKGELSIKVPRSGIDPELLVEIREKKQEIISFLKEREAKKFAEISPIKGANDYPLSSAQHRIWILSQTEQGKRAYNIPGFYELHGSLDKNELQNTMQQLIERHESLRTVFCENENGEVRQHILSKEDIGFQVGYKDLSTANLSSEQIKNRINEENLVQFDLVNGPLLKLTIFKIDENKSVLSYVMHHIISDGWSMHVLLKEFITLYSSIGHDFELEPLSIQYKDYTAWQIDQLSGEKLKEHRDYWTNQFSGKLPILDFPKSNPRPRVKTYNGNRLSTTINSTVSNRLKELVKEEGATLYMGLMACVYSFLNRYTGQDDIIIGSPVAGRNQKNLENQIGFYVNTLALRLGFEEENSLREIVQNVKKVCSTAYEYQVYPFDSLVSELEIEKDLSRNPLFDVMVVLQESDMTGEMNTSDEHQAALSVKPYEQDEQFVSKFDFTFNFGESSEGIELSLVYNSDIYDEELISSALNHFHKLLEGATSDTEVDIAKVELLTKEEKDELLNEFNSTEVSRENKLTIVDCVARKSIEVPNSVAVRCNDETILYAELEELSSRFASFIRANNVNDTGFIGVKLPRNEWMVVAILGVLKTGAAYVPIDPNYPQERIDFIEKDSACQFCVNEAILAQFIDDQNSYEVADKIEISPNDLAYVIYTSGSTGLPKGVMIEHRNAAEMIEWALNEFAEDEFDTTLFVTSMCFDLSIFEMFFTLSAGKTIEVLEDGMAIEKVLSSSERLLINTVPSVVAGLLSNNADFTSVASINMAGEPIPTELMQQLDGKVDVIRNLYGPSEDTTYSTFCKVDASKEILIGRPISNTKVYIINENNQLLPKGITGEICLSGAGLARGYLNLEDLTNEKFVTSPFDSSQRMYKTGDLGKWTSDGEIQFIGRKDDQVKINGYRIELGEIKTRLEAVSGIEKSIVLARTIKDEKQSLIGYFVSDEELNAGDIRNELSRSLPRYLLPQYLIQIDEIPLTPNGKVDKDVLPDPDGMRINSGVEYLAPRNTKQKALTSIFERVLGRPTIGINDNFFVLGGDSIKSIQIVSQLKQKGYKLNIEDIMNYPVVKDLADKITNVVRLSDQGLMLGEIPLSPIQNDFLHDDSEDKHHYNQAVLLASDEPIIESGLRECLNKLVEYHDSLRMVYHRQNDSWIQKSLNHNENYELQIHEKDEQESFLENCEKFQASMNLENGPLFKVLLQKSDSDKLLIVAHHLVIDGVSWRILFEDLSTLYEQFLEGKELSLPLKTDNFGYWQNQNQKWLSEKRAKSESEYWTSVLSDNITPVSEDFLEGTNLVKESNGWSFNLSKEATKSLLTECYAPYRTEINDLLLTALSRSFGEVFNVDKLVVKLEGHGRESLGDDLDIGRTIGWFTSEYPIVLNTGRNKEITNQLVAVKEYLHRIPNNGIGYGLMKQQSMVVDAKPSVAFNYLGDFGSSLKSDSGKEVFQFSGEEHGEVISGNRSRGTLIDVSGIIVNDELSLTLIYSESQFKEETIAKIGTSYKENLTKLVNELSSKNDALLTPVDLTYQDLTIEQVNKLNSDGNLEDVYGLSPLQEGIYYHWSLDKSSPMYCNQMAYSFRGQFDEKRIEKSYALLVKRHAMLRTSFTEKYGESVLQIVKQNVTPAFTFLDVSKDPEFSTEEFKNLDSITGYNLEEGTQMRLTVVYYGEDKYEFIWNSHHVIVDAWSSGLLISEFFMIYNSLGANDEFELPSPHAYSDYVKWLSNQDDDEAIEFWKEYLSGFEPKTTFARPVSELEVENLQKEHSFSFGSKLTEGVREICQNLGITENSFMQVVWGVLLGKYQDSEDVVFGSVVSGRPSDVAGIDEMIGMFVNSVPVRIKTSGDSNIRELLLEYQKAFAQSKSYQYTQLADLYTSTDLNSDAMDNVLAFQNYPSEEVDETDTDRALLGMEGVERVANDLTFYVVSDECLEVRFVYNGSRFYDHQIKGIQGHLINLFEQIITNSNLQVSDVEILSEDEKSELREFNSDPVVLPENKTVMDGFEERVLTNPDHIAVIDERQELTYAQLNERANQLAHYLKNEEDIGAEDIVGIKSDDKTQVTIAMLAILKTGGAFLPIDLRNPADRVAYIEENSSPKFMLDEDALSMFNLRKSRFSKENLPRESKGSDLAYLIYTSGSTGKPKAVMIENHSLYNYCHWFGSEFNLGENDRATLFNAVGFDGFVWDLFPYLMFGSSLVVVPEEVRTDVEELNSFFIENKVSICFLTTKLCEILFTLENKELRTLIVGGDRLNKVPDTTYDVVNMYGPTETTIVTTFYPLKEEQGLPIPIGKPITNAKIFVLSDALEAVPVGVIGELCIGGPGLARGYLNDKELTDTKFVNYGDENERIYRTGDLVRWLPDGNIEFVGRKDSQVKVRGFRIEIGEIESYLDNHPNIEMCAVTVTNEGELDAGLTAYFVSDETLEEDDLRVYLKEHLPHYMIPGYFHQLEALPMNSNSKLDRKALTKMSSETGTSGRFEAPETDTEIQLAAIWQELLGRENVGRQDDFFEIGGHSLKATRLSSMIHSAFDVKLIITELFSDSILADQARLIDTSKKVSYIEIPLAEKMESYPLSSSQHRLWVLSHFNDANIAYNMPGHHLFKGEINSEALQNSFDRLIGRHEVLRTVFREDDMGEVAQWILPADQIDTTLEKVDLRSAKNPYAQVQEELKNITLIPFDLAEGPLLRFTLYQLSGDEYVLGYVMHHIIGDGWSLRVMLQDTLAIYESESKGEQLSLDPLRINYKDYAVWQQSQLEGEKLSELQTYWNDQLSGEIPILSLPTDKLRPSIQTYNGGTITRLFGKEFTSALKAICRDQNATIFMGVLAGINALFHRYTGQTDIIIGSVVAGREHANLSDQIGFYINTLPLRVQSKGEQNFTELLKEVKKVTLGAYEHQSLPFDAIVEGSSVTRDPSRSPLFDVMLVLQNTELGNEHESEEVDESASDANSVQVEYATSTFDLTFGVSEVGEDLSVSLSYNSDLYHRETAERMLDHLQKLMSEAFASLDSIALIDYLEEEEKTILLEEFNNAKGDYPKDKTIIELFENQVNLSPDQIAINCSEGSLTYGELNERSNQLAEYLRTEKNVQPKELVGVMFASMKISLLTSIIAALKCGSAYLPIDPNYPQERIDYMTENSKCTVVLDATFMQEFDKHAGNYSNENKPALIQSNDLAYVIYTSGSTGNPKGVAVEHKSLVNLCFWFNKTFDISDKDRASLYVTPAFDASVYETFPYLIAGATLFEIPAEIRLNVQLISEFLDENEITMAFLNTVVVEQFVEFENNSLKYLIAGGDKMTFEKPTRYTIANQYGPTENTVLVTNYMLEYSEERRAIPIGKPIDNVQVLMLDEQEQLMPIGFVGELCVAGDGLARGYLGDEVLTAQKFVEHPFDSTERIYKTGDLCRWLPDGNIEFVGRKDDQVKIRGYRIELGEIETVLCLFDPIHSAAVLARKSKTGDKELVAFVVSEEEISASSMKNHLKTILPEFMVPNAYVLLDKLPVTNHGKIDTRALLKNETAVLSSSENYVAPRNEIEEVLVEIWQEVIGLDRVGVEDNFFEIGGHSIKAVKVVSRVQRQLDVRIDMAKLFHDPTIAELAIEVANQQWQNKDIEEEEIVEKIVL